MIKTAEEFVRLRESENPEEYTRAAQEPASEEVWMDVIQRYPHMRKWVAHNKTVKGKLLEILSDDPDWHVRITVAERRATEEPILEKLSSDPDESIRAKVARHPKVTKEILLKLQNDEWERIRKIVSERLIKFEV